MFQLKIYLSNNVYHHSGTLWHYLWFAKVYGLTSLLRTKLRRSRLHVIYGQECLEVILTSV